MSVTPTTVHPGMVVPKFRRLCGSACKRGSNLTMFRNSSARLRQHPEFVLVPVLFTVAVAIRSIGIDWGLPSQNYFHSRFEADEPGIFYAVMALGHGHYTDLLSNYPFFYYLSFALFKVHFAVLALLGNTSSWIEFEASQIQDISQSLLVGRGFSVFVSGLVVVVTYLLGRRMFGRTVGLFGATFMVFSFGHVVLSAHFRLDPFLSLAILTSFYLMLRTIDAPKGELRPFLLMALALVVALATKITAWSLIVPLALLPVLTGPYSSVAGLKVPRPDRRLVFAIFMTVCFYAALTAPAWPYLLTFAEGAAARIDLTDSDNLANVNPAAISPYKYSAVWHVTRILPAEMGPAIYVLAIAGLVLMCFARAQRSYVLLMWTFLIAYMVPIGLATRTAWRDVSPILPLLAVSAGYALETILEHAYAKLTWFRESRRRTVTSVAAVTLLVIMPAWNILHQQMLITQKDTRDIAKEWIEANLPPGARLAIESYGPGVLQADYTDPFRDDLLTEEHPVAEVHADTPTYEVFWPDWDLRTSREILDPGGLLPYLARWEIDFVIVSSAFYGRYFNEAVEARFPAVADSGRLFHDVIESNLEPVVEFIPNWRDRPGPVIKIYRVPDDLPEEPVIVAGSFDPFPAMDRPASAVGYYQFVPR
jgi:hypothetical protein